MATPSIALPVIETAAPANRIVSVASILDLDNATLAERCSKGMVVRCEDGDKKLVKGWFHYRWVRC